MTPGQQPLRAVAEHCKPDQLVNVAFAAKYRRFRSAITSKWL
jgi:hypothetical protein